MSLYTSSIDRTLFRHLVMLGEFDSLAPNKIVDQLSSDYMKSFIHSLVEKPEK